MNHRENWAIFLLFDIYIYLGVFLIAITATYILFLFGIDVLGILENCKFAFSKHQIWFCNALTNKAFLGLIGVLILVSWLILIPKYKKHHKRYKKV